jgi:hypothetical protein
VGPAASLPKPEDDKRIQALDEPGNRAHGRFERNRQAKRLNDSTVERNAIESARHFPRWILCFAPERLEAGQQNYGRRHRTPRTIC